MLTFNLKKKFYEMIINNEKHSEYRYVGDYWSSRLKNLRKGDKIKFVKGYTNEGVIAEFTGLDLLTYEQLPKHAKSIFLDKKTLWYKINFKLLERFND